MGLEYIPKNTKIDSFDVNVSGADILGIVLVGLGIYPKTNSPVVRIPYKQTADECKETSKKLAEIHDKQIRKFYNECMTLIDGGEDELIDYIRQWQTFLQECDGYETN